MKLLDRNQSTRLGTNGDATEIMAHPFFNGINWDDLYNRRIDAPYKPLVNEEQKEGEQLLLKPKAPASSTDMSGQPGHMGHSIMDEDAKEEPTA